MVDRYKKSGGFIQLLQVIETCAPKKREQFMTIIANETPKWAEAINEKMLSYEKILAWKPEALMEITAQVNGLALVTSLKSLNDEQLKAFMDKLSHQEKRKIEQQLIDIKPDANQISSCVVKVVSETRNLFISGTLKYDKVDPSLAIPEGIENKIDNGSLNSATTMRPKSTITNTESVSPSANTENAASGFSDASPVPSSVNFNTNSHNSGANSSNANTSSANVNDNYAQAIAASTAGDTDHLRRKVIELTQQLNTLKKENLLMKDKLDKIKKIA